MIFDTIALLVTDINVLCSVLCFVKSKQVIFSLLYEQHKNFNTFRNVMQYKMQLFLSA